MWRAEKKIVGIDIEISANEFVLGSGCNQWRYERISY